jgi:hypothetical protein
MARRRLAGAIGLFALLAAVFAAVAYASVSTISNGYVGPGGVSGPRHSITRVYVHDYGGGYGACEDAKNSDGSWAQASPYCAFNADTYHNFCGCVLRTGWNFPYYNGVEYMTGHEDW